MKNKFINSTLLLTLLVTSSLEASDIALDTVGLNLGKSYGSYSQKDNSGTTILGNEPDKSFNSFELYTTLKGIDIYGMKPYVSYTYSSNSDLKHQYILVGLNKYYKPTSIKVNLYTGVLVGYGQMDWKYDPLNNSQKKTEDANSLISGIQVGVLYPLTNKLSFNLNTKYLIHDYETNLKTTNTTSSIEHDSTTILSLGINYFF